MASWFGFGSLRFVLNKQLFQLSPIKIESTVYVLFKKNQFVWPAADPDCSLFIYITVWNVFSIICPNSPPTVANTLFTVTCYSSLDFFSCLCYILVIGALTHSHRATHSERYLRISYTLDVASFINSRGLFPTL